MTAETQEPPRYSTPVDADVVKESGIGSYAYLQRLLAERRREADMAAASQDFSTKIRLLRYVEAEARSTIAALQANLAEAQNEVAAAREETAAAQRDAAAAREEIAAAQKDAAAAREEIAAARRDAAAAREETAAARRDAAAAREELAKLQELIRALYNSTSWRITGPMRRLMRLLRREVPALAPRPTHASQDLSYEAATALILERYNPVGSVRRTEPLHALLGSAAIVRRRLSSVAPRLDLPASAAVPRYSIVTPYFGHKDFFRECAKSVAALLATEGNKTTESRVEWIVVNDDPSCSEEWLRTVVPPSLAAHTRILSNEQNLGIARTLNRGIAAASRQWIALLDCDDLIEPHALDVLDKEIKEHPHCRYFSSSMIDIDEEGCELRRRRQDHPPEALFDAGMVMGHLVVFRRDLFDELGGFDPRFAGVQDYDFALRAAAREPLRQVPQHLYRYRWHRQSQSVARAARQERLADAARASFLRRLLVDVHSAPLVSEPLPQQPRGLCVIRTQGTRIELLKAAVESVQAQSIPMTACVVVHGSTATRDFVEGQLRRDGFFEHAPAPVVLVAPEPEQRRGYPCNVALDLLRARPGDFDVLCFLDDDDHLLPNFTSTLLECLRTSQADLAYGMTNALPVTGEPFQQHHLLPAAALFQGNFMPINSYLVRTPAVLAAGARFDEELDYLEDWDFLIQLMAAGVKAVPAFVTVAEYRLLSDGNAAEKRDPEHFELCLGKVRERAARAARRLPQSRFWRDVLDFPSDRRLPFNEHEVAHLKAALDLFECQETAR